MKKETNRDLIVFPLPFYLILFFNHLKNIHASQKKASPYKISPMLKGIDPRDILNILENHTKKPLL